MQQIWTCVMDLDNHPPAPSRVVACRVVHVLRFVSHVWSRVLALPLCSVDVRLCHPANQTSYPPRLAGQDVAGIFGGLHPAHQPNRGVRADPAHV